MTVGEAMERAEELRPGSRVAARTRQRWLCEVDGMLRERFFRPSGADSREGVGADLAWDDGLRDDDVLDYETGFDADEVRLYRQLEDAQEPDVGEQEEPDDLDDLEEEDTEEEPDEEPDADADDVPALGSTLVRVGHLHFKVEVVRYNRTLDGIRDKGIFDRAEIAEELKRRLLHND